MNARRDELASLVRRLSGQERLVTVTGPGGVGKTWMARRATDRVARAYRNGAHLVELGDVGDAGLLGTAVADSMGLRLGTARVDAGGLVPLLADRHALLVLDRCEHLLPDCARFVATLLQGCPGLHALTTSRAPLRITGEQVFVVPPLSVPTGDSRTDPFEATRYDAVAFFVERVAASAPDFRLTDENVEAVCELCARLDGNPLALELAAARVRLLAPEAILDRLHDRYRLLGGTAGQPRALRASVDASWDLCTGMERLLWARLSVLPADFDLDAAEEVASGDGIEKAEVLDLVESLLDTSVLTRESDPSVVRYSMSETLRVYGAERLGDEARRRVADRHLRWCGRLVADAAAEWFGPRQVARYRQLRREHSHLRSALDHATRDPRHAPHALHILRDLEACWVLAGRATEARHWLSAALRHGTGRPGDRAAALALGSWLATLQGDLDEAEALLGEASRVAAGDPVLERCLARSRGGLAAARGAHDEAEALLRRSVEIALDEKQPAAVAEGWFLLGLVRLVARRPEESEEALSRCLALCERVGESQLRASALGLQALGALERGEPASARLLAHRALRLKVEIGDWLAVAVLLEVLAWVAHAEEEPVRAAVLLGAADGTWRRIGLTPASVGPLGTGPLAQIRSERLSAAQEALGGRGFARHHARGNALSPEAAVRYATEDVLPTQRRAPTDTALTSRELAVAELVARGLSNREIAAALVISVRTVQGHIENILRKLRFGSRAQVAAWVAQRHLESTS